MKVRSAALAAVIAVTGIGITSLVATPSAQAVTWTKTASTKANAYSWNGYKATTKPAGFSLPSGNVMVSRTITVKKSDTTVARNVTSARLAAGNYKVYSTFKYRTKTPYRAYRTWTGAVDDAICTVTRVVATDEFGSQQTTWSCKAEVYDGTYAPGYIRYISFGYVDDQTGWVVGDVDPYKWFLGTVTGTERYTAYKYGTTKTAHRYRTHTVNKVSNYRTVTLTGYRTVKVYDTLTRVRRVFGSSGTLVQSSSYLGNLYRWRTSAGGTVYAWFSYGTMDQKTWYA